MKELLLVGVAIVLLASGCVATEAVEKTLCEVDGGVWLGQR